MNCKRPVYYPTSFVDCLSAVPCLLGSVESYVGALHSVIDKLLKPCLVFRDQEIDIHGTLDIARHFGPLHKHATTPIPRIGLEEVHGELARF
jgi:hypothetical protein